MTLEELETLIASGEGETLEVKVALAIPTIGLSDGEDGVSKDDADPSGMLVIVDDGRISAKPVVGEGEVVGVLPVKTYAGLYYQVAWGPTLDSMTMGEKVKASGDMLYLGVVRQTGESGFYKIMVSER